MEGSPPSSTAVAMVVEGGKGAVEEVRWECLPMSMGLCGGGDHGSGEMGLHTQSRRSVRRLVVILAQGDVEA